MPEIGHSLEDIGPIVGTGGQRSVHESKRDSEKVVGITHEAQTPEFAKATYYLQNILHVLHPDHFPKYSYAQGESLDSQSDRPDSLTTWLARKRDINPSANSEITTQFTMEKIQGTPASELPREQFNKLLRNIDDALLELGVPENLLDIKPANFIIRNNTLVYVDTIHPFKTEKKDQVTSYVPALDREKLTQVLNRYPEATRAEVQAKFDRYTSLYSELTKDKTSPRA